MRIKDPSKLKTSNIGMIYGENGSGKTLWTLSGRGKVLLVDLNNELGFKQLSADILDKVEVEVLKNGGEYSKFISNLDKYTQGFDTIILDNVTQLEDMYRANNTMKAFKDWAKLNSFVTDSINDLKTHCIKEGKDLWVLAHQEYDESGNYDDESISSTVTPAIRKAVKNSLMGMMDYIFHTYIDGDTDIDDDNKTIFNEIYKVHVGLHHIFKVKCRGRAAAKKNIEQNKVSLEKLMMLLKKGGSR